MANQHPSTANALNWTSLPLEIRLLILTSIANHKHTGWASLASVCKERHRILAARNLARLKLRPSCLDDLGRVLVRQRGLVRHIYLNVELPRYTCRSCEWFESASWGSRCSTVFSRAVWDLFSVLSAWEPGGQLTLELNAQSPSDSEHWFKNFHFDTDEQHLAGGSSTRQGDTSSPSQDTPTGAKWHDPRHDWIDGRQVQMPPAIAIMRLFSLLELRSRQELPRVDAVTRLVIRRQCRRCLIPRQLQLVLEKLGRLEHLVYEQWPPTYAGVIGELIPPDRIHSIENHLPRTLKRLSLFQDSNKNLYNSLRRGNSQHRMFERYVTSAADPALGAALALRSLDLEQVTLSFMVNAEDFFQACAPMWTWEHLQTLALTSQLLQPEASHQEVNALLTSAGEAALQMPRLSTMVLWNGAGGHACAFIYRADSDDFAHLTWRGTWDLEVSPAAMRVWQTAAAKSHSLELRTDKQLLQGPEAIKSHGDAIHYLNLPSRVVESASLWQMRMEVS